MVHEHKVGPWHVTIISLFILPCSNRSTRFEGRLIRPCKKSTCWYLFFTYFSQSLHSEIVDLVCITQYVSLSPSSSDWTESERDVPRPYLSQSRLYVTSPYIIKVALISKRNFWGGMPYFPDHMRMHSPHSWCIFGMESKLKHHIQISPCYDSPFWFASQTWRNRSSSITSRFDHVITLLFGSLRKFGVILGTRFSAL